MRRIESSIIGRGQPTGGSSRAEHQERIAQIITRNAKFIKNLHTDLPQPTKSFESSARISSSPDLRSGHR